MFQRNFNHSGAAVFFFLLNIEIYKIVLTNNVELLDQPIHTLFFFLSKTSQNSPQKLFQHNNPLFSQQSKTSFQSNYKTTLIRVGVNQMCILGNSKTPLEVLQYKSLFPDFFSTEIHIYMYWILTLEIDCVSWLIKLLNKIDDFKILIENFSFSYSSNLLTNKK